MNLLLSKIKPFLAVLPVIALVNACIPARQFEDIQKKEKSCRDENAILKNENQNLKTENTELKASGSAMQKSIVDLTKDTSEMGSAYFRLTNLYNELTKSYDKLIANSDKLLAGNTEETRKVIAELNRTKEDLIRREDQMRKDSIALTDRENKLAELKEGIKEKQARVDELESILRAADSTVTTLKKAVTNALLGYTNNGLTVYEKDGRVYVSMEERLLFASGSTIVEKNGEKALKDLAKVLAENKDININVEGHTDNVPINGTLPSGAKDNWELSTLRATSVVQILLKNSTVDPTRITASGKGPYIPIDPASTAEARKKNRRTEIILSPKLDDLMKVLERIK
jgi:chemotaxis protein MotB